MKKSLSFLILIFIVVPFIRSEDIIYLEGYYKNFSTVLSPPAYNLAEQRITTPDMGAVINRLRLKLTIKPSHWLSFHTAYDLSPRIQDPLLSLGDIFVANIEPDLYRFNDFRSRIYPEKDEDTGSFGLYHNLDRFFVTVKTRYADIFIGRQALSWGSARIINPTDIIAPFTFNELDPEERRGIDAIRIRIPLGMMDELDMGYIAGKDFHLDKSAFYLRSKFYVSQTDVSLLLLGFHNHFLIGMDIARSIGGAGFWLEAAYVIPRFFNNNEEKNEDNYSRVSIGLDYNLAAGMYGFLEYHFNSAGKSKPESYLDFLQSTAFRHGSVYLMGKHYLGLGLTCQITPLIPFTSLILFNVNDKSLILSPQLEYNISENIYIAAGSYIGLGKRAERVLGPINLPPLLFHSEFGGYPDMFYTSFRVYF